MDYRALERQAVKLLRKGERAVSVASKLKLDPSTVSRWAAKNEISLEYPFNRHADRTDLISKKEIIRLRKKRNFTGLPLFSCAEIGEMLGCSATYVKIICAQARKEGRL